MRNINALHVRVSRSVELINIEGLTKQFSLMLISQLPNQDNKVSQQLIEQRAPTNTTSQEK